MTNEIIERPIRSKSITTQTNNKGQTSTLDQTISPALVPRHKVIRDLALRLILAKKATSFDIYNKNPSDDTRQIVIQIRN